MKTLKQYLPDVLAVFIFVVISFAYFYPADIEGRILYRHDSSASKGVGKEIGDHMERTGELTRWVNSVFSGMPTYQTSPSYDSMDGLSFFVKAYHLGLPENVWYVFVYLLGFYIFLRAFDFRHHLAILGSVIWAFSSYFFIIIAAGHIWKVMALAYLPPMIAGVVLAYRGRYLAGLIVTSVFAAFEVYANHVQMTYYYLLIILMMVLAYLIDAIREKRMAHFMKATGVCVLGALIGISLNISNLYHTWEYSKESMRGKSELVKQNSSNQTDSGLERDYITQYSYGVGETWSLLVPNVKGGTSERALGMNEVAQEEGDSHMLSFGDQQVPYSYFYNQMPQYWEEPPGTSGPVYVGAFVLMLFVLGLFVVKGPMKWTLLVATVLSIMLAWGRNFMDFTNFFIDYIPMYSKFRTVESILVIAEFTIPLLAMMALKRIVDEPELLTEKIKWVYVSFALTGGVALLFALMPGVFFDFVNPYEMKQFSEILPPDQLSQFIANLEKVRQAIFTADCWRSLWIILIGTLCLLLYKARKMKATYMVIALTVLCLIDMWQVNKRYLYDDMFVSKSQREAPIQKTPADEIILNDTENCGNHRVLNLASNTFNENETSYYHKSIGGYHAAKLRRYQELIDAYIAPEVKAMMQEIATAGGDMTQINGDSVFPVLNMLNTKYVIVPLQDGKTVPVANPYANGNAWFADKITYVDNANAELDALKTMNLKAEAVADKRFKDILGEAKKHDDNAMIEIKACESDRLEYDVKSATGGIVVFSEVYYPGWTATVDGKDVEVGRVNYLLRAINIEPGNHKVELTFKPKSIKTTETIAYVGYGLLLLLILAVVFIEWKKKSGNNK